MSNPNATGKQLSTWAAAWLVAKREITAQVRTKSFIISSAIMLVIVFALTVVGGIFAGKVVEAQPIAVTPETEAIIAGNPLLTPVPAANADEAQLLVQEGSAAAGLLPSDESTTDPLGFYVVSMEEPPEALLMSVTVGPRVEILAGGADQEQGADQAGGGDESGGFDPIQYIATLVFGMVFLMSAMAYGSTIAQNTVVEKQTRTVELLLSAIPATSLLAGKIIGNSILAIGQAAAILLAGVAGLLVTGQTGILSLVSASAIWFVVFFVFGFVLVASIFAASASLVSRIEDTGSVLTPVMLLTMLPYFVVVIFGSNPTVMAVASYFPFTSTVAMPVRMMSGYVPVWEALLSILILIVSDLIVIRVAAQIYRASLLRMGPRIRLREALRKDA